MPGIVALTGATGFVGAAAARHLAASGWRIRALVRRMPQDALMPGHELEIVLGDLDDRATLERFVKGADAIVHSAGLVRALTPIEFFQVNEGGTAHILEAAAKAAPRARFVHISSLAAREPQLSPYAASKQAAEVKLAALAGERDWVALRPPAIYGPGDHELLPLFKAAKLGLIAYPAEPDARASAIHVADLAAAIAALLQQTDWRERIVEIDDEQEGGHDWAEIIQALGQCFAKQPFALRLPRPLMAAIAAGVGMVSSLTGQPRVLSPSKIAELYHPDWVCHGPRLSGLAPWRPRFGLREGFADTLAWYRSRALL
ncbi:NAD-dependent epimerase/dehydratase family protein [Dongia sp.]|uniref:NAD-dependent epimerase/dehydratase family protein n=1 Tax=Dongia sp. TaxID=1977262 RepID=UPI0035B401C6